MKVNIGTYSFGGIASYLGLGPTLLEKFQTIKSLGFDGVELLPVDLDNDVEDIKKWAAETGLEIVSVHAKPTEEIVKKITSLPARIYGLQDRGILKKGYQADVVIFDPERITDCATYEAPRKKPQGVDTLIVNGKIVMEDTGISGLLPGWAIKKGR